MYRDEHDAAVLRARAAYEEAEALGMDDALPVSEDAPTAALIASAERLERVVWRHRSAAALALRTRVAATQGEPSGDPRIVSPLDQNPARISPARERFLLELELRAAMKPFVLIGLDFVLPVVGIFFVATLLSMLESCVRALGR